MSAPLDHLHPTEILIAEHEVICSVLSAVEAEADRLEAGAPLDASFWHAAVDFFAGFADSCHHNKEEAMLFPALVQAGLPQENGPVACLLDEHEAGRGLNRAMRAALGSADSAALRISARRFAIMLRQHIDKENHVLFEMARRMISGEAERRLRAGFELAEKVDREHGTLERYARVARDLCARTGTPFPEPGS